MVYLSVQIKQWKFTQLAGFYLFQRSKHKSAHHPPILSTSQETKQVVDNLVFEHASLLLRSIYTAMCTYNV